MFYAFYATGRTMIYPYIKLVEADSPTQAAQKFANLLDGEQDDVEYYEVDAEEQALARKAHNVLGFILDKDEEMS